MRGRLAFERHHAFEPPPGKQVNGQRRLRFFEVELAKAILVRNVERMHARNLRNLEGAVRGGVIDGRVSLMLEAPVGKYTVPERWK